MNWLERLCDVWNRFWFRESSTESLGILRIFYGICVFCKSTGLWGLERAELPRLQLPFRRTPPIAQLGDLYRNPIPGFDWIPPIGIDAWQTIEVVAMIAAVFWTLGFMTRLSGLVIFLNFAIPMAHSRFDYWHHSANFLLFMMLFVCLDMGRHYSYDAILFRKNKDSGPQSIAPIRMVQVLLTWVYISTLFGKLNDGWFSGTVMQVLADLGMLKGPFRPLILSTIGTFGLSCYTLFAQAFFAIFVWTRFRRWAFLFGVMLHLGIDLVMNVTTFSFQMMSLYICFIHPKAKLTEVFYDSQSTRQRLLVETWTYFDWFDRICWRDIRHSASAESRTGDSVIKWVRRAGKVAVRRPNGETLQGLRATHEIMGLLPVTFLPSFALEPFVWCIMYGSRRKHGT